MVLLASAVPMAITPAAATYPYEKKIPFAGEDNELTKEELVSAILPYMLGEGDHKLDDMGDAAYVYAYWKGKPKMITDMADRPVTLYRPVERVAACQPDPAKVTIALGECDKLVGMSLCGGKNCMCYHVTKLSEGKICMANVCGGRLPELPEVSSNNPEFIVSLKPDVIFTSSRSIDSLQEKTGIPAVTAYNYAPGFSLENAYRGIETVGKVLEKEKEAEELISFAEEKMDRLRDVTSEIPESDKPKVYFASRGAGGGFGRITRTHPQYAPLDVAGGVNVAKDVPGAGTSTELEVSKEQIIAWNPDIIIISHSWGTALDEVNDVALVLSDPELQIVNAVKNESVYYSLYPYCCGMPVDRNLANTVYLAKLFHPDKFKNLDVEEEGNEIYKRFLGVDGLFTELADSAAWMREWLDSQK